MASSVVVALGDSATGGVPAIPYNEMRVAAREAECILMLNCGALGEHHIHDAALLQEYFDKICDKNDNVTKRQFHYAFSLPGKFKKEEIMKFANDCVQAIWNTDPSFRHQPLVAWWHWNTDHDHIHFAAPRVSVIDGHNINLWWEAARIHRELDLIRGVKFEETNNELMKYDFRSKNEFFSLLRSAGYRTYFDKTNPDVVHVRKYGYEASTLNVNDLDAIIRRNKEHADEEKRKARAKQIQAIILKYRKESLKDKDGIEGAAKKGENWNRQNPEDNWNRFFNTSDTPIAKEGPLGKHETADIGNLDKKQFHDFLSALKDKTGIEIAMTTNGKGDVTGYTVIDNANKIVFKGSDVLHLRRLLNPSAKASEKIDQALAQSANLAVSARYEEKNRITDMIKQNPDDSRIPEKLRMDWIVGSVSELMPSYSFSGGKYYLQYLDENSDEVKLPITALYGTWLDNGFRMSEEMGNLRLSALTAYILRDEVVDPDILYAIDTWNAARQLPFDSKQSSYGDPHDDTSATSMVPEPITRDNVYDYAVSRISELGVKIDFNPEPLNDWERIPMDKIDELVEMTLLNLGRLDTKLKENANSYVKMDAMNTLMCALTVRNMNYKAKGMRVPEKTVLPNAVQQAAARPDTRSVSTEPVQPQKSVRPAAPPETGIKTDARIECNVLYDELLGVCVKATINGMEYKPKPIAAEHREWYRKSDNHETAALQLAMYYYQKEISAVQPVSRKNTAGGGVPAITFTDVNARVASVKGKPYVFITIGGKEYGKPLERAHAEWYRQQPEADKKAAAQNLALNYFAKDIYRYKRNLYMDECVSRGRMPWGIQIEKSRYLPVSVANETRLKYPDGNSDFFRNKVNKSEYKPGETEEQMFIRKFGMQEANKYWNYSFNDIKVHFFSKPAEADTVTALGETMSVLDEVAASFNDSLTAMFGAVVGAIACNVPVPGGGGGGGHSSGWGRKKDDDDYIPRSLFGMKLRKSGIKR